MSSSMPFHACPNQQLLRQFALGMIEERHATTIEEHLIHCANCCAALGHHNGGDPLLETLRMCDMSQTQAGELEGLRARLRSLPLSGAFGNYGVSKKDGGENWSSILSPPVEPDELGRIDGHRILRVLGVGGMGVVFEAEDTTLRRRMALKIMKLSIAAKDSARERFLRESRAVAAIDHEHVVSIYYVGKWRGIPYLTMQLLAGESLRQRADREDCLELCEVLRIGREVAEGLAAAHANGLVHRDIKLDNIWLDPRGRVKILDFGLALFEEMASDLTSVQETTSAELLGTPAFMSPEQALGQRVDSRSDLFSLGSVLYRLATGSDPFVGRNLTAVLVSVAHDQTRAPLEVNRRLPESVSVFIGRLLEKDPSRRPQSADEVIAQLRRPPLRQLHTSPMEASVLRYLTCRCDYDHDLESLLRLA